ncbi:hypothetical protein GYMLUDRAFT_244079 [Collybiopsis luxurians FD-317 M1]|uniref:RING-type domain-containing protein n=1 Tax=Collybiopsis luxurians FD-317 M1 TaxID=944289 RepID=A0A0D0BB08_9AGAR|nr:hypothetical protein GYMLUDRAFT_244079 [Collybiopsis luxurians FD-317 M1]
MFRLSGWTTIFGGGACKALPVHGKFAETLTSILPLPSPSSHRFPFNLLYSMPRSSSRRTISQSPYKRPSGHRQPLPGDAATLPVDLSSSQTVSPDMDHARCSSATLPIDLSVSSDEEVPPNTSSTVSVSSTEFAIFFLQYSLSIAPLDFKFMAVADAQMPCPDIQLRPGVTLVILAAKSTRHSFNHTHRDSAAPLIDLSGSRDGKVFPNTSSTHCTPQLQVYGRRGCANASPGSSAAAGNDVGGSSNKTTSNFTPSTFATANHAPSSFADTSNGPPSPRQHYDIERELEHLTKLVGTLESQLACPVCFKLAFEPYVAICGHTFCSKCLMEMQEKSVKQNKPPVCCLCFRFLYGPPTPYSAMKKQTHAIAAADRKQVPPKVDFFWDRARYKLK